MDVCSADEFYPECVWPMWWDGLKRETCESLKQWRWMMAKPKVPQMVRQGDVLLVPTTSTKEMTPAPKDPRGIVLAEGETSGHHHQVFGRGARLMQYKQGGQRVLVVADAGAEVRVVGGGSGGVPRHEPIALAPGKYEVRIQRSFSQGYSRRVED